MKKEEVCPLRKSESCAEKACPLWHQFGPMFEGCILKTVIWASVKTLELMDENKQQDLEYAYEQTQPCPSIELEGEIFDVLIEDNTRVMEITDRLRRCKSIQDIKDFCAKEAYRNPPGIQILN